MSLAYKENVPDTRESPVREMVKELKEFGVDVYGYDPLLSKEEIEAFGVNALDDFNVIIDCVIVAVAHDEFKKMKLDDIRKFVNNKPVLVDIRRIGGCLTERKQGMGCTPKSSRESIWWEVFTKRFKSLYFFC